MNQNITDIYIYINIYIGWYWYSILIINIWNYHIIVFITFTCKNLIDISFIEFNRLTFRKEKKNSKKANVFLWIDIIRNHIQTHYRMPIFSFLCIIEYSSFDHLLKCICFQYELIWFDLISFLCAFTVGKLW